MSGENLQNDPEQSINALHRKDDASVSGRHDAPDEEAQPLNPEDIHPVLQRQELSCASQKDKLEEEFQALAKQWRKETRYMSSANKMAMHPAYQRIISMGKDAIPLILRDLQQTRSHWLWALHILAKEDPAPENATFDQAVDAWLDWGKQHKYL
jgi:hypothetical protein